MSRHHQARAQRAARAALAPSVDAGVARCRRCGELIEPGQPWDAGHLDDLALGGNPAGPSRVEHARRADCAAGGNRAAGARLGNSLRAAPRRRLAAWLELVVDVPVFWDGLGRTTPRVSFSLPRNLRYATGSANIDQARPQIFRRKP